ncbi:dCTP deaminase/dUTPase family protein [Blattabacterium cuenoti]|uniref:deoxyuridine 5'-triphosphate nucleotidohydrolase n=1 Tax=Blattabacterium cuenoti TaxID=1653831 RepID=UPI001EECE9BE|nr:deoxyuridine 5'-triphosphate nucleotidohydrolase [Blattabacterium cuenoti]
MERILIPTAIYIKLSKINENHFFIKKKIIDSRTVCLIHFSEKKSPTDFFLKQIKIVIINLSLKSILIIQPYEKIAIMDITKTPEIKWKSSNKLNKSIRGSNSFGSTGI